MDGIQSSSTASPTDLGQYTLSSAVEVAHALRQLMTRGDPITVYSNHGKTFVMSRILDVDPKVQEFVFEWGGSDEMNRRLLQSTRNVFVAMPDGIKMQFATEQVAEVRFQGRRAFLSDFPADLIKLQRREFFRLDIPTSRPARCWVGGLDPFDMSRRLDLHVKDISLGGLGFLIPPSITTLTVGRVFKMCRLDLGADFGILPVTFTVVNSMNHQLKNGNRALRIGCRFEDTTPAMQTVLQRYIANLERERRAMMER